MMTPVFYCTFYITSTISTSNPPTKIENLPEDERSFPKTYIKKAISFYFSYYYFYSCDDENIENRRKKMVKEKFMEKLDSDNGLDESIKEDCELNFENSWSGLRFKYNDEIFGDSISKLPNITYQVFFFCDLIDSALIKMMLRIENELINDRLLFISLVESLCNSDLFIKSILPSLLYAKTHIEPLNDEENVGLRKHIEFNNSKWC
ncbi:hypothetical protein LUQ84_001284 [Hamiltosporidium tvaerminnensis]|nr:hypothetical protein LUQ84_001284 [Hamiltosporidium tvaerminnensis]